MWNNRLQKHNVPEVCARASRTRPGHIRVLAGASVRSWTSSAGGAAGSRDGASATLQADDFWYTRGYIIIRFPEWLYGNEVPVIFLGFYNQKNSGNSTLSDYDTCAAHMLKCLFAGWQHVYVTVMEGSPVYVTVMDPSVRTQNSVDLGDKCWYCWKHK